MGDYIEGSITVLFHRDCGCGGAVLSFTDVDFK
jgi:hypothetical protein